jgi:hypothetical protein
LIEDLAEFERLNNLKATDEPATCAATNWASAEDLLGVIYPQLWVGGSVIADSSGELIG